LPDDWILPHPRPQHMNYMYNGSHYGWTTIGDKSSKTERHNYGKSYDYIPDFFQSVSDI